MASPSTPENENFHKRRTRSPETAPSHDRSQPKRRRRSEEQDGDQSGSRSQAFGYSTISGNARTQFGHQYFQGDVVQYFHDAGASQDKDIELDQKKKEAARVAEIMASLSFEQMDSRRLTIGRAHAKTCQWLLSKKEYRDWRDENKLLEHHGFLWLKGKPAAGKSTAMKFLYDDALKQARGDIVISFFFNARGDSMEMSVEGMYRSLLHQLLEKVPELQSVFDKSMHGKSRHAWTVDILKDLFSDAVHNLRSVPLICYTDALDESNEDDIRDMITFLQRLAETALDERRRFWICFSSRHYPNVTIRKGEIIVLEKQEEHDHDIAEYIRAHLYVEDTEIAEQIGTRASGVFLWVVLVVNILNKLYDRGRVDLLYTQLRDIPDGLDKLFEDTLTRGPQDHSNLLTTIQWVLYSERPLTCQELYHAVLDTSYSSAPLSEVRKHDDMSRFILDSSKGLAEIAPGLKPVVQFIHESVRDYLIHGGGLAMLEPSLSENIPGHCHDRLKGSCLRYVLANEQDVSQCFSDTKLPLSQSDWNKIKERSTSLMERRPLLGYALKGMIYHGESARSHGIAQETFVRDFPSSILGKALGRENERFCSKFDGILSIVINENAMNLLEETLRHPDKPLAGSKEYFNALYTAVKRRNVLAVSLLLPHVPGVISNDFSDLDNILSLALKQSKEAFKLILEHRPFAFLGGLGKRLLDVAMIISVDIAQILVSRGARLPLHDTRDWLRLVHHCRLGPTSPDLLIDAYEPYDWDRLMHTAVSTGHDALIKELHQRGVIFKRGVLPASNLQTSSHEAMGIDDDNITRTLLERGPNGNFPKFNSRLESALHRAVSNGNENIVRMLLLRGTDVNLPEIDSRLGTALQKAVGNGNENITRMLLDRGAKVNVLQHNLELQSVLQRAVMYGSENTILMLLETGAVVNVSGDDLSHVSPLQLAATRSDANIVAILLDHGACINSQIVSWPDGLSETLLELALDREDLTLLRRLLSREAQEWASSALLSACECGSTDAIKLLLDHGANVNTDKGIFRTPLLIACRVKRPEVVAILLDQGANVNLQAEIGGALRCAVISRSVPIVQLLLSAGPDVNEVNGGSFRIATRMSDDTIVRMLREYDAKPV